MAKDKIMELNKKKISRQELYEQVWSTPLRTLAKGFGISDVGLAKACRRNNIPLPGLGYWAKVQAGKKVSKIPLPNAQDNSEIRITVIEQQPKHVDETQFANAEILLNKIQEVSESIGLSESTEFLHPIAKDTWRILKQAPESDLKVLTPENQQYLSISVTKGSLKRAILFFDLLIRRLDALGCSVILPKNTKETAILNILGESIPVELKENVWGYYEGHYPNQKFKVHITGKLTFSIAIEPYWHQGIRRNWTDAAKQRVENCVNSIIAGLVRYALSLRSKRIEDGIRAREWAEKERVRIERERKEQEERERIEQIEKQASYWHKAETIRAYLTTVRNTTLKKHGHIDEGSEMDLWLKWGFAYAEHLDPVPKVVG
jgi:hypothetical protein